MEVTVTTLDGQPLPSCEVRDQKQGLRTNAVKIRSRVSYKLNVKSLEPQCGRDCWCVLLLEDDDEYGCVDVNNVAHNNSYPPLLIVEEGNSEVIRSPGHAIILFPPQTTITFQLDAHFLDCDFCDVHFLQLEFFKYDEADQSYYSLPTEYTQVLPFKLEAPVYTPHSLFHLACAKMAQVHTVGVVAAHDRLKHVLPNALLPCVVDLVQFSDDEHFALYKTYLGCERRRANMQTDHELTTILSPSEARRTDTETLRYRWLLRSPPPPL
jgi:hypothetical protein